MIILSDTFYEFADPLMRQLGRPTLFCHRLVVDADGRVRDYRLRQPDQKRQRGEGAEEPELPRHRGRRLVQRHRHAAAADAGFFIHPPPAIAAQFPQFPVTHDYAELTAALEGAALRLAGVEGAAA